jgi:hypothetical protein
VDESPRNETGPSWRDGECVGAVSDIVGSEASGEAPTCTSLLANGVTSFGFDELSPVVGARVDVGVSTEWGPDNGSVDWLDGGVSSWRDGGGVGVGVDGISSIVGISVIK